MLRVTRDSVIRVAVFLIVLSFPSTSLALGDIELPPGFVIEEYADVPNARSMALGPKGTLFVSNRRGRSVYAVTSTNGVRETIELLGSLNAPNGVAIHGGDLYVAEIDRVTRYADIENHLYNQHDGAILDIFSAIVLVVPLILPIAAGYGVNEVHLGIVFLAAMQLGYLTPPVGLNLFIASYRFDKPIMHVYSATFPFLVILMMSVVLITFLPQLSLLFLSD